MISVITITAVIGSSVYIYLKMFKNLMTLISLMEQLLTLNYLHQLASVNLAPPKSLNRATTES